MQVLQAGPGRLWLCHNCSIVNEVSKKSGYQPQSLVKLFSGVMAYVSYQKLVRQRELRIRVNRFHIVAIAPVVGTAPADGWGLVT